jgi:hypothetical protein
VRGAARHSVVREFVRVVGGSVRHTPDDDRAIICYPATPDSLGVLP